MTYTGSKAQPGRGSKFAIGATPVEVGEVTDSSVSRPAWDTVDVTNLDSGLDNEFITTIRKSKSFTLKYNRVSTDAGQVAVEAAYESGAITPFTLTLLKNASQTTTGDSYTFSALVLSSDFDVSPTKQIEGTVSLQSSGQWTFTAGS